MRFLLDTNMLCLAMGATTDAPIDQKKQQSAAGMLDYALASGLVVAQAQLLELRRTASRIGASPACPPTAASALALLTELLNGVARPFTLSPAQSTRMETNQKDADGVLVEAAIRHSRGQTQKCGHHQFFHRPFNANDNLAVLKNRLPDGSVHPNFLQDIALYKIAGMTGANLVTADSDFLAIDAHLRGRPGSCGNVIFLWEHETKMGAQSDRALARLERSQPRSGEPHVIASPDIPPLADIERTRARLASSVNSIPNTPPDRKPGPTSPGPSI